MSRAYLFQWTEGLKRTHMCARLKKTHTHAHMNTHIHTSSSCPLQTASSTVTQNSDLNVTDLAPLVFESPRVVVSEGTVRFLQRTDN